MLFVHSSLNVIFAAFFSTGIVLHKSVFKPRSGNLAVKKEKKTNMNSRHKINPSCCNKKISVNRMSNLLQGERFKFPEGTCGFTVKRFKY